MERCVQCSVVCSCSVDAEYGAKCKVHYNNLTKGHRRRHCFFPWSGVEGAEEVCSQEPQRQGKPTNLYFSGKYDIIIVHFKQGFGKSYMEEKTFSFK